MSQEQRIGDYLKSNGSIEPLTALSELGVYRLSDVILKLRRKGWDIETVKVKAKNRFGEPCNYAKYLLNEEK